MTPESFNMRTELDHPAAAVFAWHARPGALERLTPPWEQMEVVAQDGTIRDGERTILKLGRPPLRTIWRAVHHGYVEGQQFCDRQERGPFSAWDHVHRFVALGDRKSALIDEIEYRLPLGPLGRALAGGAVRRRLERTFRYRGAVLTSDLERHAAFSGSPRLRVAITGSTGLIGRQLWAFLASGGHDVHRVVRGRAARGDIAWDPARGTIDRAALEGLDAVVHLAGENVGRRWTEARKERILSSRVAGTRLLAEALAHLERPPKVFVSASATGFYGTTDREVDETAPSANDFLAQVCRGWESAAEPAQKAGIRVVHPRMGVVLSPAGGALERLLTPFSFGVGGPIGDGRQWMSWVAIDDVVGAFLTMLYDERLRGPVNLVAPSAVTNREFARTLGDVLRRPAVLPLPSEAVRAVFGEMGETMLLSGAKVRPRRLGEVGFEFRYGELAPALCHLLGRSGRPLLLRRSAVRAPTL
jgi:uncharacterized protein (TIGR01777 family)